MLRALPGLRISGSCVVAYSIDLLPLTAPGLFLYDCHSVFYRKKFRLRLPSRTLVLGERTLIMGVLNVTPDSFSDGGAFLDSQAAVARALELERDGAEIVNDISALRTDLRIAEVARHAHAPIVLMHMRGTPRTMQRGPFARSVIRDVMTGLHGALARARRAGLAKSQILLDPGIGFGKSQEQNFEILARLPEFACLGCPIVIGTSRKAFLGKALANPGEPPLPP